MIQMSYRYAGRQLPGGQHTDGLLTSDLGLVGLPKKSMSYLTHEEKYCLTSVWSTTPIS